MKKARVLLACLITLTICVCFSKFLYAWNDTNTHPQITRYVLNTESTNQIIANYLFNSLGFKDKMLENFYPNYMNEKPSGDPLPFIEIIAGGAKSEDLSARGLNHFYEPILGHKLHDRALGMDWDGKHSNLDWASGGDDCDRPVNDNPDEKSNEYNDYSWKKARDAFRMALTGKTNEDRDKLFIWAFRSLGQVVHLMQDMAVPAHTRNDFKGHAHFRRLAKLLSTPSTWIHPTRWMGNNLECFVAGDLDGDMNKVNEIATANPGTITIPSFSNLREFWDTDEYDGNNISSSFNNGLAEYSSANFLSTNTKIGEFNNAYLPRPTVNDTDMVVLQLPEPEAILAEDGNMDKVMYFHNTANNPPYRLMSASRAAIKECVDKYGLGVCRA